LATCPLGVLVVMVGNLVWLKYVGQTFVPKTQVVSSHPFGSRDTGVLDDV